MVHGGVASGTEEEAHTNPETPRALGLSGNGGCEGLTVESSWGGEEDRDPEESRHFPEMAKPSISGLASSSLSLCCKEAPSEALDSVEPPLEKKVGVPAGTPTLVSSQALHRP